MKIYIYKSISISQQNIMNGLNNRVDKAEEKLIDWKIWSYFIKNRTEKLYLENMRC